MSKGRTYPTERINRTDPVTGRRMLQLTSFPTTCMHLPYWYRTLTNGFTADSRALVLRCMRSGDRDAPWDLFRVDVDGANLTQLTERDRTGGIAVSPTRGVVYFYEAGTLFSVDLDTLAEEEIAHGDVGPSDWGGAIPPGGDFTWGIVTPDDAWYFIPAHDANGRQIILRYATDGSDVRVFDTGDDRMLHSAPPDGRGVLLMTREADRHRLVLSDVDGNTVARYGFNVFAHSTPLGRTGLHQGCGLPPVKAILTMAEGQDDPEPLVEGPLLLALVGVAGRRVDRRRHELAERWPAARLREDAPLHAPRSSEQLCRSSAVDPRSSVLQPRRELRRVQLRFDGNGTGVRGGGASRPADGAGRRQRRLMRSGPDISCRCSIGPRPCRPASRVMSSRS